MARHRNPFEEFCDDWVGLSSREIGRELGVSAKTVEDHSKRIGILLRSRQLSARLVAATTIHGLRKAAVNREIA